MKLALEWIKKEIVDYYVILKTHLIQEQFPKPFLIFICMIAIPILIVSLPIHLFLCYLIERSMKKLLEPKHENKKRPSRKTKTDS